ETQKTDFDVHSVTVLNDQCNEVRPVCGNCRRLESECTWPPRKPPVRAGPPYAASSPATVASGSTANDLVATGDTAASFTNSALAVADLRLLHHYTLHAAHHIGQTVFGNIHWHDDVVKLSFDHHFLLRGILAVSALHLATTARDENISTDLLLQSAVHMDAALGEFRSLLQNRPDTEDTYNAIFCLACLLAVHRFGSLKTQPDNDPIDAFIHCAGLIQGAKLVQLPDQWSSLKRDDISAIVSLGRRQRQAFFHQKPEICLLRERICAMSLQSPPISPRTTAYGPVTEDGSPAIIPENIEASDIDTEADRMVYLRTIDELNDTFSEIESCGFHKPFAIGLMCAWPASLSNSFMTLLSHRRPLALVVLAHFAVLLRDHEASWYLSGWHRYLLDAVEKAIPPGFEVLLAWPRRCIRGVIIKPRSQLELLTWLTIDKTRMVSSQFHHGTVISPTYHLPFYEPRIPNMKLLSVLTVVASATAVAIPPSEQVPLQNGQEEIFLIESAPGQRQWVTEDQKWQLRREGVNFLDITDERAAGIDAANSVENGSPAYPDSLDHVDEVKALTSELSKKVIEDHLTQFTSFHTRYFKSKDGIRSATWLFEQVQKILDSSGASATGATVSKFNHPWGQFSVIARIPGRSNDTVVIGAHQDSINLFLPSILAAPGADDDGSGTVTILEALRVFLKDPAILHGKASNTVEFHWYSAEEGGLLGSQAVFKEYRTQERTIKAMLQQDMTGYVQGTINAGQPESVGVITDYVDPGLTEFIKRVITE
ncbi:Leucine aminopeptidase 1, partial [Ascosphaera aggregata]